MLAIANCFIASVVLVLGVVVVIAIMILLYVALCISIAPPGYWSAEGQGEGR